MKLRIIQWNIRINSKIEKILQFLNGQLTERTIINLQEVSERSYEALFKELGNKSELAFSLLLKKPGKYEGMNRKMGIMTIVVGGKIVQADLIHTSLFPERSLTTVIEFEESQIKNMTFHSLTGVDYKKGKSSNFASIASYLSENTIDVFSCDANEPKVDSFDEGKIECFDNRDKGKNAGYLFGKNKVHDFVDSWKQYALREGKRLEQGFTYIAGKSKKRYDYIFAKPNWNIERSMVDYDASIQATSDHSIVITDYLI